MMLDVITFFDAFLVFLRPQMKADNMELKELSARVKCIPS